MPHLVNIPALNVVLKPKKNNFFKQNDKEKTVGKLQYRL